MKPWTSIWIKTRKTIDQFKDSNWVQGQGLFIYIILGINAASGSDIPRLFDSSSKAIFLSVLIIVGIFLGVIFRIVWVNLIFYFGKIWRGQATKRNIDTVLALCFIPEIFRLISLLLSTIIEKDLSYIQINDPLTIICTLLSLRILLIGLSRIQKFSYGISLLNIFVPALTIGILVYSIRGL